ncbi:MAG: glycosyltransferase [Gammaproteobacteria bacterium]
MNILFLTQGYKPAFRLGGPIVSVSALAETLVQLGHEVSVVTTNSNFDQSLDVPLGVPHDVDGVTVRYFERREILSTLFPFIPYFRRSRGFSYSPDMGRYLRGLSHKFDVVHTQLPFTYPTIAGARYARRTQTPLFYNQRGVFHPNSLNFRSVKKRQYIKWIERPILDQAAALVALTQTEVGTFAALGTQTPAEVVPNGIAAQRYRTIPKRAPAGVSAQAQVVLFLGRLHPSKGADSLLEAFLKVAAEHPDATLVLAGPDEFELEDKFKAQVTSHGLTERVVFPGMVIGDDKLDWLARADLFVLPSHGEGFSMAILEALASATPVLITPACNFPEVESAGCGVVSANAPAELANRLRSLLSDPQELVRMGQAGRELMVNEYTWERIAGKLLGVYERGIARFSQRER